ncbi:MAG: DUF4364 family protein [Clostridia bacterium]|nr:DUF4364 family protein [Clostridia bacterium]
MKKRKPQILRTMTDIKVFLLYVLDRVSYPMDDITMSYIIVENAPTFSMEYNEALLDLVASGHVHAEEIEGKNYYIIEDLGRMVARELYDTLDPELREKSEACAAKYISIAERGGKVVASVTAAENGRFFVDLEVTDAEGLLFSIRLARPSRAEAEALRENLEQRPNVVWRSLLFAATGKLDYLS